MSSGPNCWFPNPTATSTRRLLPDSMTVAPVVPIAVPPARPVVDTRVPHPALGQAGGSDCRVADRGRHRRILVANRQQSGPVPAGQPWSMTGGNPGKTNANPAGSPITDPTVQWRTETNGRIEGAPVEVDGVVYIGNGNNHFYAIDAESGLIRWDTNLRKPVTRSAAVSDGIVVVGTSASLFGLDNATGNSLWQRDDLVAQSAPAIAGGSIFLVDADDRCAHSPIRGRYLELRFVHRSSGIRDRYHQ